MTDPPATIAKKIKSHAYSGGGATKEEHEQNGGNPDIDVAYQYLSFFEDSDDKMEELARGYREGRLSTREMKEACIEKIQGVVASFQSVCSSRKLKLMSSDVKLLPMKSFEITRIQRGLLILLLLLERDYRYYAFYITAIIYHVFGIQYSEDRSPKQLRWRTFRQNY